MAQEKGEEIRLANSPAVIIAKEEREVPGVCGVIQGCSGRPQ